MLLNHCCSRVRSFMLVIIGVFRRALCCFSRRRRNSQVDFEQLNSINVVSNSPSKYKNVPERDWNSWDDSPKTVEEHIEAYRQKLVQPSSPEPEPVQNIDFFEDMTPKIVKQKKILIKNENSAAAATENKFSRLEANCDIPVVSELEDWDESAQAGWDEISDANTKQLIREKRKEQRNQKQKQKKHHTLDMTN